MKKIFLMIVVVAVLFAGCGNDSEVKPGNDIVINPIESEGSEIQQEETDYAEGESPDEYVKTGSDVFLIENPFCDLYYPAKWQDSVKVTANETGDTVCFYGLVNGKEVPLFEIVFNVDGDIPLGTITNENGNVYVAMNDKFSLWPEDLTEDETMVLSSMSEDMNVVVSKLVYESGMELDG
ncbi:MAG: hypothetical protein IJ945_06205 [Oscillospiraceae bacterium]|nr:hypothetical protein [Oscillospiraceae bacterium]